jgi:uncharacterized protein
VSIGSPGQGHYPYQAPLEAYGNGGFRFAGMSHKGSLMSLPTGMFSWSATTGSAMTAELLAPVLDLADRIDVLLIGLGHEIAFLDPDLRDLFRSKSIIVEAISTGGAVRTYNILLAEQRAIAAALIAVDSVR